MTTKTIEQLDEQFGTAVIFPDYCLPSEEVSKKIEKTLAESNATFDCGCATFKELKKLIVLSTCQYQL